MMKEEGTVAVAVAVLFCAHFCAAHSANALLNDSRGGLSECSFEVELRMFKGPLVHRMDFSTGKVDTRIVKGSARIHEASWKPRTLVKLQWSFSDGEEIRNATVMSRNPGEVGGHPKPKPVAFVAFRVGGMQNVILSSVRGEADHEHKAIHFVAYKRVFAAPRDTVGIPIDVMVNDVPCRMEEDHQRPQSGDLYQPSHNWCWGDEGGELQCGARASFCCSNTVAMTKEETFEHEHDNPSFERAMIAVFVLLPGLLLFTLVLAICFPSALVIVAGCIWRRRDQRVDSNINSEPPSTAGGCQNLSPSDAPQGSEAAEGCRNLSPSDAPQGSEAPNLSHVTLQLEEPVDRRNTPSDSSTDVVQTQEWTLQDGSVVSSVETDQTPLMIGASGRVVKGVRKTLKNQEETVAIKFDKQGDSEAFKKERKVHEKIRGKGCHKNIIWWHGAVELSGREGCTSFHVMEWVPVNLKKLLEDQEFRAKCVYRDLLLILRGIACGMQHLNDNEIIHFDLNPMNVMIAEDLNSMNEKWTPKITDFGLSRTKLSVSCEYAGTLGYIAPEIQWLSVKFGPLKPDVHVHASVDVYSFGVIMRACSTKGTKRDTPYVCTECQEWFEGLIQDCVQHDSNHEDKKTYGRPTFEEIIEQIDECLSQGDGWLSQRPPWAESSGGGDAHQ